MANLIYPATDGHYVDDKYSSLVEPNLFANNILIPDMTFTDKYQTGPGGQIFVHKPGIGVVEPSHPGADFEDTIVQDSLVTIALDKQFNRSRKIYAATEASVEYPIVQAEMETAIKEVRDAWTFEAIKALIQTSGILVDDNVTSQALANGSDIYDKIIDTRKKMRAYKANPNVLIVSPTTYAKLLKAPEFQRSTFISDNAIANAAVGKIAGLWVYEYELLDDAAKAATGTIGGITWSDDVDVLEYVMYDKDAFSIVTSLETVRAVQEPTRFVGTLAQIQIVSGFKLTNPYRAAIKMYTTSTVPVTYKLNGGKVDNETDDVIVNALEGTSIASNGPTPVRAGYIFNGWYAAASGGDSISFSLVDESAKTVHAQWLQLFTVTFNLNGGNIDGDSDPVVVTDVPYGTLVGTIEVGGTVVLEGSTWTPEYWVTTADGSTDAASKPVTADVTVYAYWVEDGDGE